MISYKLAALQCFIYDRRCSTQAQKTNKIVRHYDVRVVKAEPVNNKKGNKSLPQTINTV